MAAKNTKGSFLIALGAVLVIAALSLVFYNCYHEKQSKKAMDNALTNLKNVIPVDEEEDSSSPFDVFDDNFSDDNTLKEQESVDDDTVELDGNIYMGIISFPTLGQEFPVIKGWSYADMNVAPCRYAGTRSDRDLIICAHNYSGFFDKLDRLNSGDEVVFTDIHGREFIYVVSYSELINGWNSDAMFAGAKEDWSLTLFTCTWSGYSRVTVRCVEK